MSQQLFDAVAAQLEKAKVDIEEIGRLEVSLLEAETSAKVAALEAEARGQYSLAVGRSYSRLKSNAKILSAYAQLYELSLLKPHRTVAFHGFQDQGLKAVEALMSTPHLAGELNSSMAYAGHSLSGSGELSGI